MPKVSERQGVNFVLVETPEPEPLDFPYTPHINYARYPKNWSKVSWLIRRMAGHRCVWCGKSERIRVHHMGVPFADDPENKPGNRFDKHDLRIENLYCLCEPCERKADKLFPGVKPDRAEYATDAMYRERDRQMRQQQQLREKHQVLGVGVGIVLYQPPDIF